MGVFSSEGLLLDGSKEGETRLEAHRGYAQTALRTLSRHGTGLLLRFHVWRTSHSRLLIGMPTFLYCNMRTVSFPRILDPNQAEPWAQRTVTPGQIQSIQILILHQASL
jgi:hypothetical protein